VPGNRWTIFLHGFNNSFQSAGATWNNTLAQLSEAEIDLDSVICLFWPGDYSRWEIVSALNYPRTVPIAEETAKLLTEYLVRAARTRSKLRVSFVAHSLGALGTLETCRLLRANRAKIAVEQVLLMAAAVPEGFCVAGQKYGRTFSPSSRESVLYSHRDRVLRWCFQIGQEVAQEFPPERQGAVGRSGGPGAGEGQRWNSAEHMEGFGHGSYWKRDESIAVIGRVVSGQAASRAQPTAHRLHEEEIRVDTIAIDEIPPEIILPWLARASRQY
jgi:hypothetical protein